MRDYPTEAVLVDRERQIQVLYVPFVVLYKSQTAIQITIKRRQFVHRTVQGLVLLSQQLAQEERSKRNIYDDTLQQKQSYCFMYGIT